jgi:hypothetical protein
MAEVTQDDLQLPEQIQKAREYAYVGLYEKAIDEFKGCVSRIDQ